MLEVIVIQAARITADVLPHHIQDHGSNQRVLNYEWIEIRCRVIDNCAHDVNTSAGRSIQGGHIGGQSSRIDIVQALIVLVHYETGGSHSSIGRHFLLMAQGRVGLIVLLDRVIAQQIQSVLGDE